MDGKYVIDNDTGYFDIAPGYNYIFHQTDSSNAGFPLTFKDSNGVEIADVTIFGTAGQAGAFTRYASSLDNPLINATLALDSDSSTGEMITL